MKIIPNRVFLFFVSICFIIGCKENNSKDKLINSPIIVKTDNYLVWNNKQLKCTSKDTLVKMLEQKGVIDAVKVADAFKVLIEKEVYTDVERIFVTRIIDKLFPEFVKNENRKLIGVLRNLIPEAQKSFVGNLNDLTVPAETIADDLSRISGIKVRPENIQFYRNRRFLGNQAIEIPNTVGRPR
jgi:hypothetical protein